MLKLGRLVMTSGVADWIDSDLDKIKLISHSIQRHVSGDWGEVDESDWDTNNQSVKNGYRVLSSYTISNKKIWIITEADRSSTTVLFPDEY